VRALAVTSAKRLSLLPETPTVAESGYPKFEFGSWNGIVVPVKTPKEIIARIHSATMMALKNPAVMKRMIELGYVVVGNQPEEFGAFIKTEIESLGQILKDIRGTAE
jgi:tripartite-type tricarboxylate transporter receptor subunit TctC